MIEGALVGAGVLLVGWCCGYLEGRATRRRKRTKNHGPICGCGHHKVFHDNNGAGACQKTVGLDGYVCKCTHYIGPEPLPEFYAPEIGG